MARATWHGTVLAGSDRYEMVEGNACFPPDAVRKDLLREGDRQYTCPWKRKATCWDIVVGDDIGRNAASSYEDPKEAARRIRGHLAFGNGTIVEKQPLSTA